MRNRITIIAALSLPLVTAQAHDDTQQGMMHAKESGEHTREERHAQAVGKPGNPKNVARTVEVVMTDDMKFTPARISVKRGETVRFIVRNAGQVKHEMVIGSMAELKAHAEMMRKMPGMEHADPNQVVLGPGRSGNLVWQFTRSGLFEFACLQPGHFEAGMKGEFSVK